MGKRSRKMPKTFNSFVLELETDYVQYVSRLGIAPMAAGQTIPRAGGLLGTRLLPVVL